MHQIFTKLTWIMNFDVPYLIYKIDKIILFLGTVKLMAILNSMAIKLTYLCW